MSYPLWKYFFDDDIDGFRQYLAKASFDRNASKAVGGANIGSLKVGSPGALATSPNVSIKSKKTAPKLILTRSDVNARDSFGRTLLHHAVSSHSENALEFVKALIEIPLLDLYVQDTESGWTALHRALYFGNIAAAQLLMVKDIQNATDYTMNVSHTNAGGLVKIKDHEGNSPFEVFSLTTAPRDLDLPMNTLDALETASVQSVDMDDGTTSKPKNTGPLRVLDGDEVFAFGSNKNITLGLGDGDDRTFPERIQLKRPEHLLQRLFEDYQQLREKESVNTEIVGGMSELQEIPTLVRSMPIVLQDVVMSKLHTAILTKDPISNLHICGFGPGGRLGTGDEATRFHFECIQGGGLAKRRVASIALGQDHTVAVCTSGEVFTWGSNRYGQLGYELPEVSAQETPTQLTPRQIYGLIKKEQIIGAAASSIHSAIYTASGLYTFGKNDGQLGLMDADARSLEIQLLPRRVGVSVIQHAIQSVEAIDRATAILLENHEVIVFTHYGWTKVLFPLESFGSSIASDAFFARHQRQTKHICKITSGGNTICAMTSYGEVFTVDVPKHAEVGSSKSTTNPTKARNALPTPSKIWSIRKAHMAATDAAVGQDGSVILCTAVGTVWKKEKRANIKSVQSGNFKPKLYKFVRVPNIFRAIAVRSNAFGAFTAIRKDCDVMREQIVVGPPALWDDMFNLLAFREFGQHDDENAAEPQLRYWKPSLKGSCPALIKRALLTNGDAEEEFVHIAKRFDPLSDSDYDVWVTSNVTDVRLPVHSLILKARSKILRRALAEFSESYYYSITDVIAVEYGSDGQIHLCLKDADFLTLANFVFYLYTDTLADVWRFTSKALHLAPRYRGVRTELMKIALALDMRHLERAVRVMDEPVRCMRDDFETAFHDSDLFSDANVVVDLADGEERYAHSVVLQSRCPFFEGMFQGHTGGMWMADRRQTGVESLEAIRVDLKHVTSEIFELVLRHIYADTGDELFDAIVAKDLDEFIDIVIEVMAVANELMLDRLARICQQAVGRYVTPWNICGLLNTIAESSENQFKLAGLEYIGLNLENMLDQRLLEELDDYLLEEMSETVHENQLAYMPIARSGRAMAVLLEDNPGLAELLEANRQRRLDSMKLPSRYVVETIRPMLSTRSSSLHGSSEKTVGSKVTSHKSSPTDSPAMAPVDDMQFMMDDVNGLRPKSRTSPSSSPDMQAMDDLDRSASIGHSDHALQSRFNIGQPSVSSTPQTGSFREASVSITTPSTKARTTWATPTSAPSLGLKDIMLQDSSVKISSLTQSLQRAAASSSKQSTPKVSQKERKRQQHEQKLQAQNEFVEHESQSKAVDRVGESAPQSPWQKVTAKPEPQPVQIPTGPVTSPPNPSSSMGKDDSKASNPRSSKEKKKPSTPNRTVSSPGMTGVSNAPPPQIQSIRHTPAPTRAASWLDARTSMADILSQQQYEKIAIREFADKRSLQEIQQEQEFQAWWDNESRKVQEEEAAATAAAVRSVRGPRGRGAHRKSSGRQDSKAISTEQKQQRQVDTSVVSQNADQSRSESSSRGKPRHHRASGNQRGGRGASSS